MGRNAQRRRVQEDWANRARGSVPQPSAIQAPGNGPKPPFCPMLSAMLPVGGNRIEVPGGGVQNAINLQLVPMPCALNKDCMLWDEEWCCCGLVSQLRMLSELYGEDDNGEQVPGEDDPGTLPHGDTPGGGGPAGTTQPPAGG